MTAACCSSGLLQRCAYSTAVAQRIRTFDAAALVANPGNFAISNIPNMVNRNYSGLAACTLDVPAGNVDNGMVFEFRFTRPLDRVISVRITTNYGNILNDGDNIFDPTAQVFDEGGSPLTAPFVASANNGGGFFVTNLPGGPIDGVAMLRMTNIRGNFGGGTKGIREVEMLQQGLIPAALVYCPGDADPLSWVNPLTGAVIPNADITDCR